MKTVSQEQWPALPFHDFESTAHLLHMGLQAIGKLKLMTPFEPEWANVPLWITSRGLTTGIIPYKEHAFSVDLDLIDHQLICQTSLGAISKFKLGSMSVAQFVEMIFDNLHRIDIDVRVNPKPQEVPNPISFNEDTKTRFYDGKLANAWWRILLKSDLIMQRYHALFTGKTQPIGFMWGTFDLRDARYNGQRVKPVGPNAGYLRRNAMDAAQIEAGWWSGNPAYQRAAYYSFTYPQPEGLEKVKLKPEAAHWDASLGEFILDYDDLRRSKTPEDDLLAFLHSTYQAGAELAGWDKNLIGLGRPV